MTAVPGDGLSPAGQGAVPVCPRHPGREAYVRCQRCERPVCPECQRPAAVGVQCVDCVREGARSVRTARTALGGRVGDGRPVVTQTLIGLNVVAFALQWLVGRTFTNQLLFFPPTALSEPWRFLTSAFVHSPSSVFHILFNMYALWLVGPYLESLLGRLRYVALYLLCAFGGSVGYFVLANPTGASWGTAVVGASGAVFGLFGAFVAVNRRLGRDISGIAVVIGLNFALGFVLNGIAWQGHLGGLVTGLLAGAALAWAPAARRRTLHPAALAGVGVLLLVLVAAKVATVPAGYLF
jgi:membrane associated rhomboid family serine protease